MFYKIADTIFMSQKVSSLLMITENVHMSHSSLEKNSFIFL